MTLLTYADVLNYTYTLYPKEDAKLLQDIAFENKSDINLLIRSIVHGEEKPLEININKIRKNLKRKSKKFILSNIYNKGNLFSFGADSETIKEQRIFLIPFKEYKDKPNAKIRFRYFKRSKIMRTMFNMLIMSLRSSKVNFTSDIIKINNLNYIEFEVSSPLYNETFWGVVNLWSRK